MAFLEAQERAYAQMAISRMNIGVHQIGTIQPL
jgi:hypothetical protein